MQDLHLVGFTTDRRGLIFSTRAGARSGGFVVPVTDELVQVLEDLLDRRPPLDGDGPSEAGTDDDDDGHASHGAVEADPVEDRVESRLSVREIQSRLRAGEAIDHVASVAGVDPEWVERFAPPVRAEQRRIVDRALETHMHRPRTGESAVPLRRAVGLAMAERGVAFTVAAFDAAWSSRLVGADRWVVEFAYVQRGRRRTASWEFDAATATLTTSDRSSSQIGFVAEQQAPGSASAGAAADGVIGDPGASPIGADAAAPMAASAKKKTPAKKARAKKKATKKAPAKKAPAKKAPAKKKATKKKAPAKKAPAKKKATKKKTPAKKAPAKKKSPAKKKGPAKKSPIKKKGPAKKSPIKKKSPAKKAPAKRKSPAKKSPARKKAPAKRSPAKKRSASPSTESAPAERSVTEPPASEAPASEMIVPEAPSAEVGAVEAATVPHTPEQTVTPQPSPNGQHGASPAPTSGGASQPIRGDAEEPDQDGGAPGLRVRARRADEASDAAVDRQEARQARAAQRTGPAVQFRSGAPAPVRTPEAPGRAPEDTSDPRSEPDGVAANGAARPRRRRQLRAR